MAKAMMVFEDNETGGFTAKAVFEPPLGQGAPLTNAQRIVLGMCSEAGKMVEELFDRDKN